MGLGRNGTFACPGTGLTLTDANYMMHTTCQRCGEFYESVQILENQDLQGC